MKYNKKRNQRNFSVNDTATRNVLYFIRCEHFSPSDCVSLSSPSDCCALTVQAGWTEGMTGLTMSSISSFCSVKSPCVITLFSSYVNITFVFGLCETLHFRIEIPL